MGKLEIYDPTKDLAEFKEDVENDVVTYGQILEDHLYYQAWKSLTTSSSFKSTDPNSIVIIPILAKRVARFDPMTDIDHDIIKESIGNMRKIGAGSQSLVHCCGVEGHHNRTFLLVYNNGITYIWPAVSKLETSSMEFRLSNGQWATAISKKATQKLACTIAEERMINNK